MLEVGFDEREELGIGRNAGEMSYCGVDAVRLDEVLNFDGFLVFGVIELERGGNDFSQSNGSFTAFNELHSGRTEG